MFCKPILTRFSCPGQLGVLLISDDGNAALWPDFGDPQLDPLTSRITGNVSALASNPNPGTSAILAVVGLTDGSLQKFVRNEGVEHKLDGIAGCYL